MQKLKFVFLLFASLALEKSLAQQDPAVIEYINTYKDLAVAEMTRTGMPASIKLAQGIHETSAGTSDLVKRSNNHFGLKCKSEWTGMTVRHTDDAPNECFRKYGDPKESYLDQSDYLKKSPRYASLFQLDPTDYKGWAFGLKKAGYATNPKYSQIIIKLIEDYNLQDYTLIAMGKMKAGDEALARNDTKKEAKTAGIVLPVEPRPVVMPAEEEIVVHAKKEKKIDEKKEPVTATVKQTESTPKPEYPDGEFKINDTRVIYAKKGTSFLSIAEKYNIPLARIFEFNDNMKVQEILERDQLVYIMRKRKFGLNETHVVKEGESLTEIAQTEALRIESLLEYNFLAAGAKPTVGSILYLRIKSPTQTILNTSK